MVAVAWILLAVVAEPPAAAVSLTGATACPAPADVEAALAGLIPAGDPGRPPDVAELKDDAGSVIVALRRGSGEAIGEKRLNPDLSCEQRARAAAVIVAAWEARLATPPAPLVVQQPDPPPVVRQTPPPASLPPPAETQIELGVAVGGSINGTNLAPTASIEVAYARGSALVVPAVAALIVGSHDTPVGSGTARWRRYGLVASAASRRDWKPVWAEARVAAALTALDIAGNSFPRNGAGVTFDPGLEFGARVGLRSSRLRWWIDGTIAFWPRGQEVFVQGAPDSATLPRGQALISLGAAYEIR